MAPPAWPVAPRREQEGARSPWELLATRGLCPGAPAQARPGLQEHAGRLPGRTAAFLARLPWAPPRSPPAGGEPGLSRSRVPALTVTSPPEGGPLAPVPGASTTWSPWVARGY